MKKLLSGLALTTAMVSTANAQSASELINGSSTPEDILVYGMGYDQKRFSPLNEINKDNISSLAPVWAYSPGDTRGQERFPLISNGVMYATTHSSTFGIAVLEDHKPLLTVLNQALDKMAAGKVQHAMAQAHGVIYSEPHNQGLEAPFTWSSLRAKLQLAY